MPPRDKTNKSVSSEPLNILDVEVGDLCQFKGTRNKGYRRIMEINREEYFCRVVEMYKGSPMITNYTSTNSKSKLNKVYRNGQWSRVVRDSLTQ